MKKFIPLVIIVISLIIAIYLYPVMPEQMATHWNAQGIADGYGSKAFALFLMPAITLLLYLLFVAIPRIDPLKRNIQKFRKYYDNFIIIIVGFLFYIYLATLAWNYGCRFNMGYVIIPAMAVLLYYCGILVENARRNWFIGIRTPWTLSSDIVWKKTHAVGAKFFKAFAVLSVLSLLIINFAFILIIATVVIGVAYLFVYSYFEYKKLSHKKR